MESLYPSDNAPVTPPGEAAESEAPGDKESSVDEQEAAEATAVIDNKILSPDGEPLKEGDEVVLVVVKNFGDESEVKYAPKEPASPTEAPGGDMAGAEAELDQMSAKA